MIGATADVVGQPQPIPGVCRGDVCLHLVGGETGKTHVYARNIGIDARTVHARIGYPGHRGEPTIFLLRGESYAEVTVAPVSPRQLDVQFFHKRGVSVEHVIDAEYRLPIPPTYGYSITQQPGQVTSHALWEINAHDFSVEIGTPILAARGGRVIEAEDGNTKTCKRPVESCLKSANFLGIEHEDATVAYYVHLQHDSIVVEVGESVVVGQHIANSGNTGFSTGPHLHFDVVALSPSLERMSLAVTFGGGS